jgi:hypothetical protein
MLGQCHRCRGRRRRVDGGLKVEAARIEKFILILAAL